MDYGESSINSVYTMILQGEHSNCDIGIHGTGRPVGFVVSATTPALTLYFASNAECADQLTLFFARREDANKLGTALRAGGLLEVVSRPIRDEWRGEVAP